MTATRIAPDPTTSTEALVSTAWLLEHLDDPAIIVLEVDEHPEVYDIAHVPGAHRIDWNRDLVDPVRRDFVDHEQLGDLLGALGVTEDSTIVLYGDQSNWWATYAFWLLRLFDVPNVRVLDGGRDLWIVEQRQTEQDEAPRPGGPRLRLPRRNDGTYRIYRDEVAAFAANAEGPLIDV